MSDTIKREDPVLQSLDLAMEVERAGHRFYLQAAEHTTDANGKHMFTTLAHDELKHFGWLASQRLAIEETGHYAPVDMPDDKGARNQVFPEAAGPSTGVRPTAHELDALQRGIQAEQDSINLYEGLLAKTADPSGQGMLKRLVAMEEGHLQLLEAEYDYLTRSGIYFGVPEYTLEGME